MVSPALHFARTAQRLALAARAANLVAPAFRTPPRCAGARRTIRFLPGGVIVAVATTGRHVVDIDADMVDGVVAANRLTGEAAARVRHTLRAALREARDPAAA